jgi:hypothetical protein
MALTTEEQLLMHIIAQFSAARGMSGSEILIGGGTPDVSDPAKTVIAIQSLGTTYTLGAVVGNCSGLSGYTALVPFLIEGSFSSVTAGPLATDVFLVYYA